MNPGGESNLAIIYQEFFREALLTPIATKGATSNLANAIHVPVCKSGVALRGTAHCKRSKGSVLVVKLVSRSEGRFSSLKRDATVFQKLLDSNHPDVVVLAPMQWSALQTGRKIHF